MAGRVGVGCFFRGFECVVTLSVNWVCHLRVRVHHIIFLVLAHNQETDAPYVNASLWHTHVVLGARVALEMP